MTCEEEMQYRVAQDARPYLYLRMLIPIRRRHRATSCKHDAALDVACQMADMLEVYPQTLSLFASHVEMVSGHALHALGRYPEASALLFAYTRALASTPNWRDIATLCSALSILCCDDEDSASRALELAKPIVRAYKEKDETPSVLNHTFALFASGCAL